MTELARIVVGIDGRSPARDGLALAQRFARLGGGHLTVVCAHPPAGFEHTSLMFNGMRSEQDAAEVLRAARDRLADPGSADLLAVSGSMPVQVLHDVAARQRADLLVVGGAEHGRAGRVLGGSVLTAALVHPSCPVAVPPRGRTNETRHFRRIGVAVDGSAEALAALRWAHGLALAHDDVHELRLLGVDREATSDAHDRGATAVLAAMNIGGRATESELKIAWTQAGGPVVDRLAELSRELDLLVIGTHGRRRLSRLLHGSVSGEVARSAHCPVVAVPLATTAV